jgi:hypothetical protein
MCWGVNLRSLGMLCDVRGYVELGKFVHVCVRLHVHGAGWRRRKGELHEMHVELAEVCMWYNLVPFVCVPMFVHRIKVLSHPILTTPT